MAAASGIFYKSFNQESSYSISQAERVSERKNGGVCFYPKLVVLSSFSVTPK